MRWGPGGTRVAETIFEAAAFQRPVKAICQAPGCGHSAVFQPHGLWWRFRTKHWSDLFVDAAPRFRCLRCGQKLARLETTLETVTRDTYPLPDEGEWKRALSRFRC